MIYTHNYEKKNTLDVWIHFAISTERFVLGLRHLTVVDGDNKVVGILTRKDLMGFNIDEKLKKS